MNRILWVCVALVAACGGGAPASFSARVGSAVAPPRSASGGLEVATGVTLERARIVLRQLRVERDSDSTEVKISEGPLLLDAEGNALGAAVQELVAASIPAGTYDELKVSVHVVDAAPQDAAAGFADMIARRASVLLEGTVDGKPYTFASSLEAELEQEAPFTVGGANANLTLNLDPTTWFKDAAGNRLDPSDPAQRSAIEANIKASFSAFQDDDEEGHEDRNDDHGGSGGASGSDGGSGSDDGGGHH